MRKVMVFGVFDGIHEGHRFFFKEAKELGDYLIAVVADDEVVQALKGKLPVHPLMERIARVEAEDGVDKAAVGDFEMGSWDVIKKLRPDVIATGYDQKDLRSSIENALGHFNWLLEIKTIPPHEPEKYHSSIIGINK